MGKLCKDQLFGRLVALFKETDQSNIDDAVAQAKDQLTAEAKQARRNDLDKLFDSQIATLKDRNTPEQIVGIFQNQKGTVLAKASEEAHGDGRIPFIPVIPRSFRSPYDLMAMVRNGSKMGYAYPNPTAIFDIVETPQGPYYIYDVEDGESTRGKSPENAEEILKSQKRFPLTAAEVMALTTHTDVLSKHCVWAVGSRYDWLGAVPGVSLGYGGRPALGWFWASSPCDRWGSASCGSRIRA